MLTSFGMGIFLFFVMDAATLPYLGQVTESTWRRDERETVQEEKHMITRKEHEEKRAAYWPFKNLEMSEPSPANKWKNKKGQGGKNRQPKKKSGSRRIGLLDNNAIRRQQPKTMPRLIVRYRS